MPRIATIAGDGIGPELIDSAVAVLTALSRQEGLGLEFVPEAGGAATYRDTGEPLAPGALDRFRHEYAAVLKGPVGLPDVRRPDGTEAGLLGGVMRSGLDTYANVRPIRLLPGIVPAGAGRPAGIDYVIVRENTEGLYASRGAGVATANAACDQLLITRAGTERVVRFSFELARRRNGAPADGAHRVTCIDKSNVLRSFALFRRVFDEVASQYPDVEAGHLYADAAGHDLVARPEYFDVLVTENFVGDILSDVAAATVGGLGMCPAANIGDGAAYFEPVHGSAPGLAGTGRANPTAQILAGAMLLEHIGAGTAATRLRDAVDRAYSSGDVRLRDGSPAGGTSSVTAAVLARL